ncbi:MAG: transposase family protein [Marinifilaceae bacterium]|jgi:hypothetical protein|nr:transposase family protein [Marinifilaceae bacterium]
MDSLHKILKIRGNRQEEYWISQSFLLQYCKELNEEYLRQKCRYKYKKQLHSSQKHLQFLPDTGKSWRWAKKDGTFYYDYDRIPDRKPSFYKSKLPTRTELLDIYNSFEQNRKSDKYNEIRNKLITLQKTYFHSNDIDWYMYSCEFSFSAEKARQMAESRAWLLLITDHIETKKYKIFCKRKEEFYSICADILAELKLEGLKVKNGETLRKKINKFPIEDTTLQRYFFISRKYGNTNRRIVGDYMIENLETGELLEFDIHKAIMYDAWMNPYNPQVLSKTYLYENVYLNRIQQLQDSLDIEPISYRAFCDHLNRFGIRVMTTKERYGNKEFSNKVQTYTPAYAVNYSDSMWVVDGSGTKMAYAKYIYDKNTGQYTTKQATLYAVRIFDVASRKLIGYSIGDRETKELVQEAVHMAVKNNNGKGCMDILSDNGPAFQDADVKLMLDMVSSGSHRTIKPGNSQENPAEMFIKLFTSMCREFDNWLYLGFNSHHRDNQSNPDYLTNSDKLPSRDEAIEQIHEAVNKWNSSKLYKSELCANDIYEASKNPGLKKLDDKVERYLFAENTVVTLGYQRGYVNVFQERKGEARKHFLYEIPDFSNNIKLIDKALGGVSSEMSKVRVYYNDKYADLYTLEGNYILTCETTDKVSKTPAEETKETIKALGHHKQRKETLIDKVDEFRDSVVESLDYIKYDFKLKDKSLKGNIKDEHNQQQEEAKLIFRNNYKELRSKTDKTQKKLEAKIKREESRAIEKSAKDKAQKRKRMLKNKLKDDLDKIFDK